MKLSTLFHLGFTDVKSAAAEQLYLRTGRDITKPMYFTGYVNERCNIKCRYCDYWRLPHYQKEMPIEAWQQALLSLKDFVGRYVIAFTGGEPFIKPGFIDLLLWCHQHGIGVAVTTNGTALTTKNAQKIAESGVSQINVSLDTHFSEVNDYLRGKHGLLSRVTTGIGYLREARDRNRQDFPIILKPTITSKNFRHLPELVEWAKKIGATGVNIAPLHRHTAETYNELWIEEEDLEDLRKVLDRLLEMKTHREPIINSAETLRLLPQYFRESTVAQQYIQCRHVTRNFAILPNGNVQVCDCQPSIGNVCSQSARDIWYGEKAQQVRREKITCTRRCLTTPLAHRSLNDKVKTGLNILRYKDSGATS